MALEASGTNNWQKAYTGNIAGAGGACKLVTSANYLGSIGTIANTADNTWRVDRQSPPAGKTNLQIQKNGATNPSTIACVIVPNDLSAQCGLLNTVGPLKERANARHSELTRMIHSGLTQSVGSRRACLQHAGEMEIRVFEVKGTFSA